MTSGMGTFSKVRAVTVLAAAAASLHELRYLVGYSGQADEALAGQGHAYLAHAGSLIGVLLAVAVALFLRRLRRASVGAEVTGRASPFLRLWLVASLGLVVVYIGQEGIEGLLAPGHPAGLAGIVGHGGWTAFVFAPLLGAVVALLVRGSDALIERVAAGARPRRRTRLPLAPPPRELLLPVRIRVLARNLAGRAPPTSARS